MRSRPVAPRAPDLDANIKDWERPRSYEIMKNIDTMLSQTRFSAVSAFYDTQGGAFKFKAADVAGMINSGILAYGKPGDAGYRTPTVGVNVTTKPLFSVRNGYKKSIKIGKYYLVKL